MEFQGWAHLYEVKLGVPINSPYKHLAKGNYRHFRDHQWGLLSIRKKSEKFQKWPPGAVISVFLGVCLSLHYRVSCKFFQKVFLAKMLLNTSSFSRKNKKMGKIFIQRKNEKSILVFLVESHLYVVQSLSLFILSTAILHLRMNQNTSKWIIKHLDLATVHPSTYCSIWYLCL